MAVTKLNSVQKRAANDALADAARWNEEQKFLEDLRGELWKSSSPTWAASAAETKLSPATICHFAQRTTLRPRFFTVRRIAAYFGYKLTFIRPDVVKFPVKVRARA